jgi:hypothetical protein
MRQFTAAIAATVLAGTIADAAQRPAAPAPGAPGGQGTAPAGPAVPAAPAQPAVPRVFSGTAGLLFNTVRADRVADFERVVGRLQSALETSTDPTVRAQAKGWKVLKAAEPGPNGTVLYVFMIDPVVPDADYGLGRILAAAITDPAQLQEVWRLYMGAITTGGTLLNLRAVEPPAAAPAATAPAAATPAAPRTP